MSADLDRELAEVVATNRVVEIAARGMCKLHGPKPGCWCNGDRSRCHAPTLWRDLAYAVIIELRKAAGDLKRDDDVRATGSVADAPPAPGPAAVGT